MEHPRIRILLADDQPEMLAAVTRLLEDEFDIVAAVVNGEEAIEAVASLDPDLLVLDISMPALNGIEAAARLKESGSLAKAIFLTVNEDPHIVEAALSVGGRGYVLKQRLATDLIAAIRHVLSDRIFVSPPVRMSKSRWEQPILT
jgi:DNA-binding NarL/FixJ family response regulator